MCDRLESKADAKASPPENGRIGGIARRGVPRGLQTVSLAGASVTRTGSGSRRFGAAAGSRPARRPQSCQIQRAAPSSAISRPLAASA
jgi:hypothetical protein